MPCYQVQSVSVVFKVAHRDLLEKALRVLGWNSVESAGDSARLTIGPYGSSIVLDLRNGAASFREDQQNLFNELKRAYSRQAINFAAKLGGWQIKNKSATKGQLVRGCL